MTVTDIINNDPVLKLFTTTHIDWDNKHQVNLRFIDIKIALQIFINKL